MTSPEPASQKGPPPDSAFAQQPRAIPGASDGGCVVCGSGSVWTFAEMKGVPVHSNVLAASRAQALQVPTGDLEMRCCRDCGHVYNAAFRPERMTYTSDYENSLFVSPTYRAYAEALVADLIKRFGLRGKRVVEIGCGSGEFLKLLCDQGENDGIGFDPSGLAGRCIEGHPKIRFVREHYTPKHADVDADFLCCRQVLEHVPAPRAFLREIKNALPTRKRVGVLFEVPDVLFMLEAHSSWDFIYEHCSYFSMSSLNRLFAMAGFTVLDVWRAFHNQFLCVCAEPLREGAVAKGATAEFDPHEVVRNAQAFAEVFREQRHAWNQTLRSYAESRAKVVLWGAGSKGVTFLNVVQSSRSIGYVVDINDQKCGKFIPGTGQRIVSPGFLKEHRPDVVILMNPAYETEVRATLAGMKINPRIVAVSQPALAS
ncbi:MAG: class I SAM-dependent methyltransferase [Nitrospirota bacterium]